MTKAGVLLVSAGLVALGAVASPAPAGAMPVASLEQRTAGAGAVIDVRHRGRPHRFHRHHRQRFTVYPGYAYPRASPYAYYRGFEDPGFAIRGNIPGDCAVDLGYGRWESCDK